VSEKDRGAGGITHECPQKQTPPKWALESQRVRLQLNSHFLLKDLGGRLGGVKEQSTDLGKPRDVELLKTEKPDCQYTMR